MSSSIITKLIASGAPRLLPALVAVRLEEMNLPGAGVQTLAAGDVALFHRWRRFLAKPTKLLAARDARLLAQALEVEVAAVELAALLDHAAYVGYTFAGRILNFGGERQTRPGE